MEFDLKGPVRVISKGRLPGYLGALGVVIGKAYSEDGRASYAVIFATSDHAVSFWKSELDSAGE
jgi:hypothetical protein